MESEPVRTLRPVIWSFAMDASCGASTVAVAPGMEGVPSPGRVKKWAAAGAISTTARTRVILGFRAAPWCLRGPRATPPLARGPPGADAQEQDHRGEEGGRRDQHHQRLPRRED